MTGSTTPRPNAGGLVAFDTLLTEEEAGIRDLVAQFIGDRLSPQIPAWYEAGHLPRTVAEELGSLGLLGMHLQGYGCAGMSAVAYGLACLELEAADSGLRSLVSVQGSLAMSALHKFGSEEQKKEWLPRMASGECIGCFGLTEADSGSDPGSMRTAARRDSSDWILDGSKMWITNGGIADLAVVWAHAEEGIRGFIVPRETPGFSTYDIPRKLSLRASITSELVLDGVRLPHDAALPGVIGLRGPLSCLTEARFGIAWGVLGAARTCFEAALSYSSTRTQFGRPIGAFQLTQEKLVNMRIELDKGLLLALYLGRAKDRGTLCDFEVNAGKLNNTREALAIARTARSILGANGITLEYPVMRHMANLESVLTYEGTSEIHTLVLGQTLTGFNAFR